MGIFRAPWKRQRIKKRRKKIEEQIEKGELTMKDYGVREVTFKDIHTSELNRLNNALKGLGK